MHFGLTLTSTRRSPTSRARLAARTTKVCNAHRLVSRSRSQPPRNTRTGRSSTIRSPGWAAISGSFAREEDGFAGHGKVSPRLSRRTLFYANKATDPLSFTGWSNIYNTVTTATSQIATNVIDCGGTGGTNASMWLMGWGETALFTIFPDGLPAGLQHVDLGRSFILDSSSSEFLGWRTWLQWNIGVCVADWRFGVRACNIDYTLFGGGTTANLIAILAAMFAKPPIVPAGKVSCRSRRAMRSPR